MNKEQMIKSYEERADYYQNEIDIWHNVLMNVDDDENIDFEYAFLIAEIYMYSNYDGDHLIIETHDNKEDITYTLNIDGCKNVDDVIDIIDDRIYELQDYKEYAESVISFINREYGNFDNMIRKFIDDSVDNKEEAIEFLKKYLEDL